jgi:damage-control phosphatase, subfamily I
MTTGFDQQLQAYLDNFIKLINKRRAFSYDLSWCFEDNSLEFIPDYLILGSFGRTSFEKLTGHITSKFVPKLWRTVIWKKIYRSVLKEIDRKYLAQIFSEHDGDYRKLPERKYFIKAMDKVLKKVDLNIRYATFSELFLFFSVVLRSFLKYMDMDHDAYKKVKLQQNKIGLELYKQLRSEIMNREDNLDIASYLCLRANWIDSAEDNVDGFLSGFFEEINNLIDNGEDLEYQKTTNEYFHIERFKLLVQGNEKTILYELDNAGEVMLDLFLIEVLIKKGHKIILAAKKNPVLNDITSIDIQDILKQDDLNHFSSYIESGELDLIHTNSGMAGKNLHLVSEEYKQAYKKADFLILKGQGNFQTMPIGRRIGKEFVPFYYKKEMIFIMGVKSEIINACLKQIFVKERRSYKDTFFLYYYNPKEIHQYL